MIKAKKIKQFCLSRIILMHLEGFAIKAVIEKGQLKYFGEIENSLFMYLSSNPKAHSLRLKLK